MNSEEVNGEEPRKKKLLEIWVVEENGAPQLLIAGPKDKFQTITVLCDALRISAMTPEEKPLIKKPNGFIPNLRSFLNKR